MVREMDLADVLAQFEYWGDHPARGDMLQVIAAMQGWKKPRAKKARTQAATPSRSILADFPNGR